MWFYVLRVSASELHSSNYSTSIVGTLDTLPKIPTPNLLLNLLQTRGCWPILDCPYTTPTHREGKMSCPNRGHRDHSSMFTFALPFYWWNQGSNTILLHRDRLHESVLACLSSQILFKNKQQFTSTILFFSFSMSFLFLQYSTVPGTTSILLSFLPSLPSYSTCNLVQACHSLTISSCVFHLSFLLRNKEAFNFFLPFIKSIQSEMCPIEPDLLVVKNCNLLLLQLRGDQCFNKEFHGDGVFNHT